jgi:hypothetical protein
MDFKGVVALVAKYLILDAGLVVRSEKTLVFQHS